MIRRSRGFGLIEVLVTLIVLAIGLLSLAALQGTGLRFNHGAYLRTQATYLAYDILDRMRANRTAAEAGNYNIGLGVTPPTTNCVGAGANCNTAALAQHDHREWKAQLANLLPNGNGSVLSTASLGGGLVFTISVQWNDDRDNPAATPFILNIQTEL